MRRILVALVALTAPAWAGEAVLVCHVGGPGSTKQAQPSLDKFLRHLEKSAGLPASSLRGAYHTTAEGCAKYMDREEPAVAVLDLATWLANAKAWGLDPVAHFGEAKGERYHLLVKKDAGFHDLDSLRGKALSSQLARDNDFASRIVLGNRVNASEHFSMQQARNTLRAVRAVLRGKSDAALVDHYTWTHIAEIDPGGSLSALFSSEGLPGLTLGSVDSRAPGVTGKIAAALPKLCTGDGEALCKALQVKSLIAANGTLMGRLQKRYDAGRVHLGDRGRDGRSGGPLGPDRNTSRQGRNAQRAP